MKVTIKMSYGNKLLGTVEKEMEDLNEVVQFCMDNEYDFSVNSAAGDKVLASKGHPFEGPFYILRAN